MPPAIRYNECLETMYGLRRFGIKLGLTTIRGILRGLGNPHRQYACVHVAGTNGKGSIAAALAAILAAAGYRVGLYTSPHLVHFNERISVNGQPISNDAVVSAYQAVRAVYQGSREPTFFEFATAMALYAFARQKVDWAVVETGMGGRLDATNIIQPAACVISNISMEHRDYLGRTIPQIAAEKGGIIKAKTPVITGVRQPRALAVIQEIADARNAPLYRLGKHFRCRKTGAGTFTYFGLRHRWPRLHTALQGDFQIGNAALATALCEIISDTQKAVIDPEAIRRGLAHVHWPGRLEIVSRSPLIILDGAHNLAAARSLARFMKTSYADRQVVLVAGILNDKPYAAMLKTLLPVCTRAIFTRPVIERSLAPTTLAGAARGLTSQVETIGDVGHAMDHALKNASEKTLVLVAGSLYVVGEAKAWLADRGRSADRAGGMA